MDDAILIVDRFSQAAVLVVIAIIAMLTLFGMFNALVAMVRAVKIARAGQSDGDGRGHLGFIDTHTYLTVFADLMLVLIGVELIESLRHLLQPEATTVQYLAGVVGAALVAIARRIIVFFNPEDEAVSIGEIYAYAVLIAALGGVYVLIQRYA